MKVKSRWKLYSILLVVIVCIILLYIYMTGADKRHESAEYIEAKQSVDFREVAPIKDNSMKKKLKTIYDKIYKVDREDLANAKEVWKRLQKVGFNSDESAELISMLIGFNGDFIYFKELKEQLSNPTLRDDVAAEIILALSGTYRGKKGEAFHIPSNERDREIQQAIRDEIISPHGKESLYMALKKLGYAESYETVMQTLQDIQNDEESLLGELPIYRLKLKYIGMEDKKDDAKTVIDEISKLDAKKQKKLMYALPKFGYSVGVIGDEELTQKYISVIKNNMPKAYQSVDRDKIREKAVEKVKQDSDFMEIYNTMTDRDQAYYMMRDYVQQEYEKMESEDEAINNNYLRMDAYKAIARALSPDPGDYLIGYKRAFFSTDDWDEKLEYLGDFWNQVHEYGEDDVKEQFLSDKEIKSALEEGLRESNMSRENIEGIKDFLKDFH